MAKLIFGMNVSLDGYVDGVEGKLDMPPPSAALFNAWIQVVDSHAGVIYGRRMYETMRYWDDDHDEWSEAFRAFAVAWRKLPKWVVSGTLESVGPNARLIGGDIEAEVRALKDKMDGMLSVSGPQIAGLMTQLGLIDAYHLYLRPFVLGQGKPFFHAARPPLRLVSSERIDEVTMRLGYVPA